VNQFHTTIQDASSTPTDISGHTLDQVHETYLKWLGRDYDLEALDVVLSAAATEKLEGDPPWLLVVGGSGAAKTESLMPMTGVGAHIISTITGEAALLSATSEKERAKDATGGLLRRIDASNSKLLVIKDVTSILSMNRDTRAQVLGALREIYDGQWSRECGVDGGRVLTWKGRIVILGAVTTAWDAAHQVIATMGDRFLLVRLAADTTGRKAAGMQAMRNVNHETVMRAELAAAIGKLLGNVDEHQDHDLTEGELEDIFDLADLITRARTAVERDFQGNPEYAHAAEMPTRLAKQLVQIGRGALALGMNRERAMAVVGRCARDTMPPLRLRVLVDISGHPGSTTSEAVKRLQLPRKTVDRILQELHLLELLTVDERARGMQILWVYSLASDVSSNALSRVARNVTPPVG
jgi:hypothetical protein